MLTVQLEHRFREELVSRGTPYSEESITFAVEFTRLLAQVLPEEPVTDEARDAMRAAIVARTALAPDGIDLLLDHALAPQNRIAIRESDLRAFGSRFGKAEEEALRASIAEEVDLGAFAERYGPAEGLLLLDSLFAVCAPDGVIDRQEIGRLTRAASELGIDPMLVGALFRKHDVRHAKGDFTFELTKDRYLIGRVATADIPLPDPQIAARHAELIRTDGGWQIVDLDSGRPTILNGNPVTSAFLGTNDQLRVGSYTLTLDRQQQSLKVFGTSAFSALSVRHLNRKVGGITLLDDVSFTVFSGEVIAVVGPSGAGKTTLLNAIAGIAPADSGDVILDGRNFHSLLANDRSIIGIVPQDDVVHADLTVEECLFYSGKLRFPSDVPNAAIDEEVDRVLRELDIQHIRSSRVGDASRRGISGGQRKRVNLGQELVTRSTRVLFLDEPTSGLDPQTAQDIVSLIRQLADDGRIVFLVTHDVTPSILSMVDHLMVLTPGGRLAWFGPPDQACGWFKVRSPDEIFARLPDLPPPEWGRTYRDGPAFRKFVRTREHLLGLDGVEITAPAKGRIRRSLLKQYWTLTTRYARVKVRDGVGLAVLLAQAPILGVAMWVVFPSPDPATMFMLALSALWFGASASVRELIAERTIWRREARVGVHTLAYILSKVTVLGGLVSLQCAILAGMNFVLLRMWEFGFSAPLLLFVTTLTGLVGMAMGLLMSAMFPSSEAAVGTLPLLLIPQITFGGLIVKVKEMGAVAKALSWLMIVRYSFEATIKTGHELSRPGRYGTQREEISLSGVLYDLGFKTTASADDMGTPLSGLLCVLVGFLLAFLLGTLLFTRRSRDGN